MNKNLDKEVMCAACGKTHQNLICPVCGSVVSIPKPNKF